MLCSQVICKWFKAQVLSDYEAKLVRSTNLLKNVPALPSDHESLPLQGRSDDDAWGFKTGFGSHPKNLLSVHSDDHVEARAFH